VKKGLLLAMLCAAVILSSRPILAHHAAASYDAEHPITLTGVVTSYELVTPHTQIHFDVTDAQGNVSSWVALSGPPQRLYRVGWRSDSLKPGDKVTITGSPSKDGKKFMGASKVVGPNGALGGEGE
jgi:hypothetical protein